MGKAGYMWGITSLSLRDEGTSCLDLVKLILYLISEENRPWVSVGTQTFR